jgi:phage/plasmid-like protein (TIGR03299 family)
MAHEVETMFSADVIPWHRLGKVVKGRRKADEAIIDGGLNWRCVEQPLYLRGQAEVDGIPVISTKAPEHKAVVRESDGSILGVVKNSYEIIQNEDCFSFMDDMIGSGQAVYETAGSLRNGKVIFLTVKLPDDVMVGDDNIQKYILMTTSHDGTRSLQVRWTPIRVVCMNTLNAALGGNTKYVHKIKHTKNYRDQIEHTREVLELTDVYYKTMETEFNRLLDTPFSHTQMVDFTKKLLPASDEEKVSTKTKNNRDKILSLFSTGRGQAAVANTRWAAFNAVTEYVGYESTVQKRGDTTEDEARFNNVIFNSGADLTCKAYNLLKVNPKIQETVLA